MAWRINLDPAGNSMPVLVNGSNATGLPLGNSTDTPFYQGDLAAAIAPDARRFFGNPGPNSALNFTQIANTVLQHALTQGMSVANGEPKQIDNLTDLVKSPALLAVIATTVKVRGLEEFPWINVMMAPPNWQRLEILEIDWTLTQGAVPMPRGPVGQGATISAESRMFNRQRLQAGFRSDPEATMHHPGFQDNMELRMQYALNAVTLTTLHRCLGTLLQWTPKIRLGVSGNPVPFRNVHHAVRRHLLDFGMATRGRGEGLVNLLHALSTNIRAALDVDVPLYLVIPDGLTSMLRPPFANHPLPHSVIGNGSGAVTPMSLLSGDPDAYLSLAAPGITLSKVRHAQNVAADLDPVQCLGERTALVTVVCADATAPPGVLLAWNSTVRAYVPETFADLGAQTVWTAGHRTAGRVNLANNGGLGDGATVDTALGARAVAQQTFEQARQFDPTGQVGELAYFSNGGNELWAVDLSPSWFLLAGVSEASTSALVGMIRYLSQKQTGLAAGVLAAAAGIVQIIDGGNDQAIFAAFGIPATGGRVANFDTAPTRAVALERLAAWQFLSNVSGMFTVEQRQAVYTQTVARALPLGFGVVAFAGDFAAWFANAAPAVPAGLMRQHCLRLANQLSPAETALLCRIAIDYPSPWELMAQYGPLPFPFVPYVVRRSDCKTVPCALVAKNALLHVSAPYFRFQETTFTDQSGGWETYQAQYLQKMLAAVVKGAFLLSVESPPHGVFNGQEIGAARDAQNSVFDTTNVAQEQRRVLGVMPLVHMQRAQQAGWMSTDGLHREENMKLMYQFHLEPQPPQGISTPFHSVFTALNLEQANVWHIGTFEGTRIRTQERDLSFRLPGYLTEENLLSLSDPVSWMGLHNSTELTNIGYRDVMLNVAQIQA